MRLYGPNNAPSMGPEWFEKAAPRVDTHIPEMRTMNEDQILDYRMKQNPNSSKEEVRQAMDMHKETQDFNRQVRKEQRNTQIKKSLGIDMSDGPPIKHWVKGIKDFFK